MNKVDRSKAGIAPKSLILIPFRFALEMTNRGWILRNVIIWKKDNCMPSSAKDRFTVDFEFLFFFSQNPKYHFKQQLEPVKLASVQRLNHAVSDQHKRLNSCYKQGLDKPRPKRNTKIPRKTIAIGASITTVAIVLSLILTFS